MRLNYARRVMFYDGDAELAPGLTIHAAGGHSAGLQFVRVRTRRGFVVLASDVSHFYENMASERPFTTALHIGEMLEGFDKLLALAPDESHIVPGHDPLVMKLYPAPSPRTGRHRRAPRRAAVGRRAGSRRLSAGALANCG